MPADSGRFLGLWVTTEVAVTHRASEAREEAGGVHDREIDELRVEEIAVKRDDRVDRRCASQSNEVVVVGVAHMAPIVIGIGMVFASCGERRDVSCSALVTRSVRELRSR